MRLGWCACCARLLNAICPRLRHWQRKRIRSVGRTRSWLANAHGISLNVILYGECGVGKTSLRNRWVDGVFTGDVAPTLGVDFNIKTLELVQEDDDGWYGRGQRAVKKRGEENYCGVGEIESGLEGSSRDTTVTNAVFDGIRRDGQIDEHHTRGGGIGADTRSSKLAPYASFKVKINVYDTSGKAAYRTVNGAYLLAFDAVLFVYDVSSVATLDVRTTDSNTVA